MKTALAIVEYELAYYRDSERELTERAGSLNRELRDASVCISVLISVRDRLLVADGAPIVVLVDAPGGPVISIVDSVAPVAATVAAEPELENGGTQGSCEADGTDDSTAVQSSAALPRPWREVIFEVVGMNPGLRAFELVPLVLERRPIDAKNPKSAVSCAISMEVSAGRIYRDEQLRLYRNLAAAGVRRPAAKEAKAPVKISTRIETPKGSEADRIFTFLSFSGMSTVESIAESTGISAAVVTSTMESQPQVFLEHKGKWLV